MCSKGKLHGVIWTLFAAVPQLREWYKMQEAVGKAFHSTETHRLSNRSNQSTVLPRIRFVPE